MDGAQQGPLTDDPGTAGLGKVNAPLSQNSTDIGSKPPPGKARITTRRRIGIGVALAVAGGMAFQILPGFFNPMGFGPGIATGNGRIEAVQIDVAAKNAGRITEILVDEGEFVMAGQVLAIMDTQVLQAQLSEAEANLRHALIGIETAQAQVRQREAEKNAAAAVMAQRRIERDAAVKRYARTEELARKGNASSQLLDDDNTRLQASKAGLSASEANLAASDAAIGAARAQVVGAEANVAAARATIQRIEAEIEDSSLKSPRDGRVQYRIAEPGEVVAGGGKVLSLVDLGDVYMTFFLPTEAAGRVALGSDVRLILDAAPHYVIPAKASFVSDVAQFTPKSVETAEERLKLTFRIKARIDRALLQKYIHQVKTGLPGVAYVKLDPAQEWPDALRVQLPQ